MDNTNQHKKNEAKKQSAISTLPNQSALVLKQGVTAEYEESVFVILSDSFALSSQITTVEERMAKSKDWARLLFPIIPENKLQDCFDFARTAHNSSFAISAYQLEQAYRQIKEVEMSAEEKLMREGVAKTQEMYYAKR